MSVPIFSYRGVPLNGGRAQTGTIEAATRGDALRRLAREFQVTQLKKVESRKSAAGKTISGKKPAFKFSILKKKVKKEELAAFCHQMAAMISAGILPQVALRMLANQSKGKLFKMALVDVTQEVERGSTLFMAMRGHPNIFPPSFIATVEAGETSGSLDDAMARSAASFERDDNLSKDIRSALIYPVIILVMAVLVVSAIVLFALPQLEVALKAFDAKIPPTMVKLQDFGLVIRRFWYLVPFSMLGFYLAMKAVFSIPAVKLRAHQYVLRVPKLRQVTTALIASRFCRTLGTLMDAGVPVVTAISHCAESIGNEYARLKVLEVQAKVEQASMLSDEVRQTKLFPDMVPQMITIGEETGEVEKLLNNAADHYEKEVERTIKTLKTAIEPLLLVVIGGIVATIVLLIVKVYADAIMSIGIF